MNNDGEKKFIVVAVCIGLLCLTILYIFLFVSLWEYRQWVGASLLVILAILIGVYVRGKINEQDLRQIRYSPNGEIPLDRQGEPMYWPQGAQPNPHRSGTPQANYGQQIQRQEVKY